MTRTLGGRGAVALAACAALSGVAALLLAIVQPAAFFPAYLAAACAWSAIPIGCLPILMIGCLVRGPWIDALRPSLRLGAATLPAMALVFVPVLVGIGWIYPWANGPTAAEVPAFRAAWLSPAFFVARTIVYFGAFGGLGLLFGTGDPDRLVRFAPAGLIAWALLASFAGIDWMLSVEPRYHSSIFGLITLSQQLLGGLSFALALACWGRSRPARTGGLGALLLSVILLWAYVHAMQFIVAWMADIPVEADWYLRRGIGAWGLLLWVLGLVQFLGLFLLLVLEPVRHSSRWLAAIAILTIAMRPLETSWLALPAFDAAGAWTAVSALVSVVAIGATLAVTLVVLGRRQESRASAGLASGAVGG